MADLPCLVLLRVWPFFLLRLETFWFTHCRIWCRFPWNEPIRKIKYNRVSLQNYSFRGLRRAQCAKACSWKTCQKSFGNKLYFTYITFVLSTSVHWQLHVKVPHNKLTIGHELKGQTSKHFKERKIGSPSMEWVLSSALVRVRVPRVLNKTKTFCRPTRICILPNTITLLVSTLHCC